MPLLWQPKVVTRGWMNEIKLAEVLYIANDY